jgi:Na+-transporting NADH:ubiquinone oxidoreductase subunit NqrF
LKNLLNIGVGIGANQEGWLAVEHSGVFGQAVAQRGDNDEAQVVFLAGGAPSQRTVVYLLLMAKAKRSKFTWVFASGVQ